VAARLSCLCLLVEVSLLIPSESALAQMSVTTSGNTIYATVGIGLTGNQCCRGASIDTFGSSGIGASCSQPCGGAMTFPFTCNWVGMHTVTGCWLDDHTNGYVCQTQNIAVTDPPGTGCSMPPLDVRFDIKDTTAANDRRVLLSNSHTLPGGMAHDYPYPLFQQFVAQDKLIPIGLRIIVDGVATSGVSVELRVLDPPDIAPYITGVPGGQRTPGAVPNDNYPGAQLATLEDGGVTGSNNVYNVASGANGSISTHLRLDANARAGDNFRIQATATTADGRTATATSGTITAWKRLWVEKKQMFRRGAPLATDAPAGLTRIIVPDIDISNVAGDRFHRNDIVALLHAPPYGEPKVPSAFHQGLYTVAARPRRFTAAAPVTAAGTVTTNGTTLIVGAGTRFNRLNPGDVININSGTSIEMRIVMAIADRTHLTVNNATTSSAAGLTFTVGDPNLVPGRNYVRLTLDRALAEDYQREPLGNPTIDSDIWLNDGVARLASGGVTSGDSFDASESLLVGDTSGQWAKAFPAAFTEYILLPPQPNTPNVPVPRADLPNDATGNRFVNKWFGLSSPFPQTVTTPPNPFYPFLWFVPPNQQMVLVGDVTPSRQDAGLTYATTGIGRQIASVLFRGQVELDVNDPTRSLYRQNADIIMEKTMVHEVAHQWQTNAGFSNHCQQVAYTSQGPVPPAGSATPAGTLFCTMAVIPGLTMPAPWNSSQLINQAIMQYGNGVTDFHIIPTSPTPGHLDWDSEYLTIRWRNDPWTP